MLGLHSGSDQIEMVTARKGLQSGRKSTEMPIRLSSMTATPSSPEPRRIDGRTLRHQHRRPEIVAALAEYLLATGVTDLSLRSAATAIGVSHVTLLRHFATREDLIVEVVAKIRADLVTRVEEDLRNDPTADLASFIERQWRQLSAPDEAGQFLLLFELTARHGRATQDSHLDIGKSLTDKLIEPFREELGRKFAMKHEEAEDVATLLVAQIRGLILDVLLSGDRERADRAMNCFIERIVCRGPN
ncbi:TetR/AcrR family transcriptional regulator [Nocardia sp. NPDC004860]|uniref:TetR/AcrR family transcriptional regulator n=1 Tax=Nocardia sp. NPDC004860 TaxID=3154557 RepID=UPI0033BCFF73